MSPALADVARANLTKLKLTKCRVIEADAATFTALDEYTHLFMYNPFSATVLEQVLSNLFGSLSRRPRSVRVVYSNPLHEDVIVSSGRFTRSFVYQPYLGYRICVYDSCPAADLGTR